MLEIGDSRQQTLHSTPETLDNRRTQTVDSRFETLDDRLWTRESRKEILDYRRRLETLGSLSILGSGF